MNGWSWQVPSGEGYATSALDTRRFLPKGKTVAQGESIVLEIPLAVPISPGKQRFAARMVDEGVAWFGSTASAEVEIVPASSGAPAGEERHALRQRGASRAGPAPVSGQVRDSSIGTRVASTRRHEDSLAHSLRLPLCLQRR